jgi:hypothetical protein
MGCVLYCEEYRMHFLVNGDDFQNMASMAEGTRKRHWTTSSTNRNN